MTLTRTVDAASEPVTLAEAKAHLRISSSAEDTYLTNAIKAARQMIEAFLGRALISQTWTYELDRFPSTQRIGSGPWWDGVREGPISLLNETLGYLEIPIGPVIAVSSIKTYNDAGTEATMDSNDYIVDGNRLPPRITLATGAVWPSDLRPAKAIKVTFTAGYGAQASDVPAILKHALFIVVAHLNENREAPPKLPEGAIQILNPYRMVHV